MILGIAHHKTPSSSSPKWDFLTICYTLARFSLGKGAPIWCNIGSQKVVQPLPIDGLKIISKKYTLSCLSSHLWGPKMGCHFASNLGSETSVFGFRGGSQEWFLCLRGVSQGGLRFREEYCNVVGKADLSRRRYRANLVLFLFLRSSGLIAARNAYWPKGQVQEMNVSGLWNQRSY